LITCIPEGEYKMSQFRLVLLRLGRLFVAGGPRPVDPEALTLHDWADLPAYHPGADSGCAVLRP
jgi:hypothetical protein